ncbi:MAG TPA: VOC family protein [Terracidiphilus sp.]|nr:VOC family protein [Terracidiphilus sp.]
MGKIYGMSRRCFAAYAASAVTLGALRAAAGPLMENSKEKPGEDAMTALTPYLLFDGNCKQAMQFYQVCFGGELTTMQVKDSPAKDYMPTSFGEKILNARLKSGNIEFSASDWLRPDRMRIQGNTVCFYLSSASFEELSALFDRLSDGGEVTDPLKEMFFGTYGALNDRFGVRWMFHANKKA